MFEAVQQKLQTGNRFPRAGVAGHEISAALDVAALKQSVEPLDASGKALESHCHVRV